MIHLVRELHDVTNQPVSIWCDADCWMDSCTEDVWSATCQMCLELLIREGEAAHGRLCQLQMQERRR